MLLVSFKDEKLLEYQSNAENLYKNTTKKRTEREKELEAKLLEYEKKLFELKKG